MRVRGILKIATPVLTGGGAMLLAGWVGWATPPTIWEVATGWNEIAAADRPAAGALEDLDWGNAGAPRIDWLGHSGFRIRWNGTTLLIDPNTSDRCTISRRLLEPTVEVADLDPIDAVLVSHAHYDHLDMPTLEHIPRPGSVVLPAGSETYFFDPRWSDVRLVPLRAGERSQIGNLEIVAVRAAHNGNRFHPLKSRQGALGYVVRGAGAAIYYSGDTGFDIDFERIRDEYRPLLAILPIGAYAPRFPMKYYHLTPEEAVQAAASLGVQAVIPCHFGTFVLALDRPSSALPRFARAARRRHVRWIMPQLLRESEMPRADFAANGKR